MRINEKELSEKSTTLKQLLLDAKEKFGSRAWSSMVVKRLEDKYGINFREKGFPDELVDNEPEEKGQEV